MIGGERGLVYCTGDLKRLLDLVLSAAGLLILSPLFLVLALAVVTLSGWPVFFRQTRVGRDGRPFLLLKYRTMRQDAASGLPITGRGDPRITRVGRVLRASKLDELPQLLNVLRGDMSFVGPRPEVPRYVARYTPEQAQVLRVRPGLTDPATVLFRDEERLLGGVDEPRREDYYVSDILPRKLAINLEYITRAGVLYDLKVIFGTIWTIVRPTKA